MARFFPFLAAFLLCTPNLSAQEKPSKPFYERDFASSPFGSDKDARIELPKPRAAKTPASVGTPKVTPLKKRTEGFFDEVGTEPTPQQKSSLEEEDDSGSFAEILPVTSVAVILNTADHDHARKHVIEFLELAKRFDWKVGELYSMGNVEKTFSKSELTEFYKRGGALKGAALLPERYKVAKLSPTWIIRTKKGEVLLEATGPLKRHFTAKGELRLPEQADH